MGRLDGKVAIVTGAGRGMGRGYALTLAREGASVVVNDYGASVQGKGESAGPADEVAGEVEALGSRAIVSYEDVSSYQGAERTVQAAVDSFGTVDILITNAGIQRRMDLIELPEEDWDAVVGTHLKGTYNFVRHAAPIMVRNRSGTIINVTSGGAWGGTIRSVAYSSAKGGIISFMLVASAELEPYGVTVNCLSPGLTATRLGDNAIVDMKEAMGLSEQEVHGRMGVAQPPEAMAPMAVFLASPEGRGITGKIFEVSGDRISVVSPPKRTVSYTHPGGWSVDDVFSSFPGDP